MTELINPQPGWTSKEKKEYEKARQERLKRLAEMRIILKDAQAALKAKDRKTLDRLLRRLVNEKNKFLKMYPTIYRVPLVSWHEAWETMDMEIMWMGIPPSPPHWPRLKVSLDIIKGRQTALEGSPQVKGKTAAEH